LESETSIWSNYVNFKTITQGQRHEKLVKHK